MHVGEFAFVLLLVAGQADLISEVSSQRFVAIGVGTLILSPLLMQLGLKWSRAATLMNEEQPDPGRDVLEPPLGQALVIGLGPVGRSVASQLETMGYELTLIDQSPINAHSFAQLGADVLAGDATKASVLDAARTDQFELIVVCVPDDLVALRIIEGVRRRNPAAKVFVRCRYATTVGKLKDAGADVAVSEEATASLELLTKISAALRR